MTRGHLLLVLLGIMLFGLMTFCIGLLVGLDLGRTEDPVPAAVTEAPKDGTLAPEVPKEEAPTRDAGPDRKSTRLNSSHT